jgi:hypothetical protein
VHSSWLSRLQIIELSLSIALWLMPKGRDEWHLCWKWLRIQTFDSWVFLLKRWASAAYCRVTLPAVLPMRTLRIWLKTGQVRSFFWIYVTEYREPKFLHEYMLGNGPPDDLTLIRGQTIIGLAAPPCQGPSLCIVRIKLNGTFDLKALTQWLDGGTNGALDEAKVLEISYMPVLAGAVRFSDPPPAAIIDQ